MHEKEEEEEEEGGGTNVFVYGQIKTRPSPPPSKPIPPFTPLPVHPSTQVAPGGRGKRRGEKGADRGSNAKKGGM